MKRFIFQFFSAFIATQVVCACATSDASNLFSGEVRYYRSMAGDKGKYYLLKVTQKGDIFKTLHKRVGPGYVGYSKCEINSKTKMIRDMGYSEKSIAKIKSNPSKWYRLVSGSSKSDLVNFVLSKYKK